MNDSSVLTTPEAKNIREDLYDSVIMLNHLTSLLQVMKIRKIEDDDQFSDWLMNFMKVVNYTSHETKLESKPETAYKYFSGDTKKDLNDKGIQLAQDYIKSLFAEGIVNYRE